jgi:hypothetical protein
MSITHDSDFKSSFICQYCGLWYDWSSKSEMDKRCRFCHDDITSEKMKPCPTCKGWILSSSQALVCEWCDYEKRQQTQQEQFSRKIKHPPTTQEPTPIIYYEGRCKGQDCTAIIKSDEKRYDEIYDLCAECWIRFKMKDSHICYISLSFSF